VTGAGISQESGVPTFRDAGGIWEKYPPEEYATLDGYVRDPEKVWAFWRELGQTMADIAPNPGHHALAKLERLECLLAVITQNVDNLHQDAGSGRVIEYHGNARQLTCLDCGSQRPLKKEAFPETVPHCACGGLMKPDVIMFGEMIPPYALLESESLAQKCDVCLVVGTSAQVFPAAQIPYSAKQHGAYVIEVNTETTGFTHDVTDSFLEGPAGEILPKLVSLIRSN